MKKILVPVDSAKPCQKTMDIATELAKMYESEIVVLHVNHVSDRMTHPYADYKAYKPPESYDSYMELSQKLVKTAAAVFKDVGIKVDVQLVSGDAATVICDYAEESNCDLIIMCSHGHSAIRRFLLGGVTSKVVHHAKVSVMVVR